MWLLRPAALWGSIVGVRGSPERDILFLGAGGEGTGTGPWWSCVAAAAAAAAAVAAPPGGSDKTVILGASMSEKRCPARHCAGNFDPCHVAAVK